MPSIAPATDDRHEVRHRPYAPSWVDGLQSRAASVPGGPWSAYLGLLLLAVALLAAASLLDGSVGRIGLRRLTYAAYPVYALALMAWLDGAAFRALHAFRPALPDDPDHIAQLRYVLTTLPRVPTLLVTLLFAGIALAGPLLGVGGRSVAGLSTGEAADRLIGDTLGIVLLGVLLYHTVHQLRAVARVQEAAVHVDLFQPAPLFAFSVVTAQTGIGLLAIPAYGLITDPAGWASAESAVVIGVVMAVATVAFLRPLAGMNRRIRTDRDHLRADAGERLRIAIAQLHDRIDAHDDPGVAHADRVVAALGREWELLDRLPTWPWRGTTLGAFASAMLVPLAIWLAQRLLEKVV